MYSNGKKSSFCLDGSQVTLRMVALNFFKDEACFSVGRMMRGLYKPDEKRFGVAQLESATANNHTILGRRIIQEFCYVSEQSIPQQSLHRKLVDYFLEDKGTIKISWSHI